MRKCWKALASAAIAGVVTVGGTADAAAICQGYGPQTPRDISVKTGANQRLFNLAPPASKMNLCDIHTHTNAEHKGPDFSVPAGTGEHGGWQCNETSTLTPEELKNPDGAHGAYGGVKPGDTIEVHWVYTSCDVAPGPGLGSCLSNACANPQLRVEAQVFLVVNDPAARDFGGYTYAGDIVDGRHQSKALPDDTGTPVLFAGSTTGPSHTQEKCSPLQVTWSVRPNCAKLDIASLHRWAESGSVFKEDYSHGVRQLVTAPELLAPID